MQGVLEHLCQDFYLNRNHRERVTTNALPPNIPLLYYRCDLDSPPFPLDSVRTRRSAVGDFLEDPNLCFSLRENDTQQQLLCNDHRNKFNVNPFGLRFGKRYNRASIYRRALQRARTSRFSPPTLFPRQLEMLT